MCNGAIVHENRRPRAIIDSSSYVAGRREFLVHEIMCQFPSCGEMGITPTTEHPVTYLIERGALFRARGANMAPTAGRAANVIPFG
jgi:hypothetical protein